MEVSYIFTPLANFFYTNESKNEIDRTIFFLVVFRCINHKIYDKPHKCACKTCMLDVTCGGILMLSYVVLFLATISNAKQFDCCLAVSISKECKLQGMACGMVWVLFYICLEVVVCGAWASAVY